jgi:predicted porin
MNKSSCILLLFCPFLLIAQEQDFQQWSKIGVSYDLNKDLSVSLDQGFRFRENASLPDVIFSNLSLKYDLIKKWSVAIGYRYITDFDLSQNTSTSHRIYSDINYRKKKKRWLMKNRLRYQYQEENFILRDKVSLFYNIRKTPLEPFTAFELFFKDSEFKKWRYTLGASYPFLKEFDIDVYYRLQQSFNTNNPKQLHILGLGMKYKF